jgi:hypothetical protein
VDTNALEDPKLKVWNMAKFFHQKKKKNLQKVSAIFFSHTCVSQNTKTKFHSPNSDHFFLPEQIDSPRCLFVSFPALLCGGFTYPLGNVILHTVLTQILLYYSFWSNIFFPSVVVPHFLCVLSSLRTNRASCPS